MKPALRNSFTLPALVFAVACSQGGTSAPGGHAGAGNGAAGSGAAGAPMSAAGSGTDMGGAPGVAGSDTGMAGTPADAGSGTAGSGTGGSGTAGSGTGGTGVAGSGTAGKGGSGSSGGPSTGGGPGALTPATFAGVKNTFNESFVNSFILMPCYSQAQQDCITTASGVACPNQNTSLPMEQQGLVTHEYFNMGGEVGKNYKVTIKVTGISEAKYYEKGTRAAGNAVLANANDPAGIDTFYTGGNPVDVENYNIYKITVRNPPAAGAMPQTGTEVQHYYLNSFPQVGTPYENHETFPLNYTHDIVVPGGGVVEYLTADRNCHAIDNCGPGRKTAPCALTEGRSMPGDNTMVPPNYMGQPVSGINTRNGAAQPYHSQILHIVVTAVAAM